MTNRVGLSPEPSRASAALLRVVVELRARFPFGGVVLQ
jgi:hypothetical protein